MFGPWAPNGYLLASIPFLQPCGLAHSWRYSFGIAASPPHGKNDFYPLTANVDLNFLTPPHGEIDFLFASRRMSILFFFSIHLTADVVFITLLSPHGDISFVPHGVNQFSLWLIARTDFILILQ